VSSAYAGSPSYAQKSISIHSRFSPSLAAWTRRPGLFEGVVGRVRLAGAISQAGMTVARAAASKYSAYGARKGLRVDDRPVLVLDQIYHGGHRDRRRRHRPPRCARTGTGRACAWHWPPATTGTPWWSPSLTDSPGHCSTPRHPRRADPAQRETQPWRLDPRSDRPGRSLLFNVLAMVAEFEANLIRLRTPRGHECRSCQGPAPRQAAQADTEPGQAPRSVSAVVEFAAPIDTMAGDGLM
jgi:hypothetical protein